MNKSWYITIGLVLLSVVLRCSIANSLFMAVANEYMLLYFVFLVRNSVKGSITDDSNNHDKIFQSRVSNLNIITLVVAIISICIVVFLCYLRYKDIIDDTTVGKINDMNSFIIFGLSYEQEEIVGLFWKLIEKKSFYF